MVDEIPPALLVAFLVYLVTGFIQPTLVDWIKYANERDIRPADALLRVGVAYLNESTCGGRGETDSVHLTVL